MKKKLTVVFAIIVTVMLCSCTNSTHKVDGLLPIPDKLVVLSFDDRAKSWLDFVGPLLKEYGFGATFYEREITPHTHTAISANPATSGEQTARR